MDLSSIQGKVFQLSVDQEFGPIRIVRGSLPEELKGHTVVAEDSCGNYFLEIDKCIVFWDHVTSGKTKLACSFSEFCKRCVYPCEADLEEIQVESAWIDPEFAKKMGIKKKH